MKIIELLEEKVFPVSMFKDLSYIELTELRVEISDRIWWRYTTEYYDRNKIKKLEENEKRIAKIIIKKVV